jgi:phosphoadenosine phosphosulfate reductase
LSVQPLRRQPDFLGAPEAAANAADRARLRAEELRRRYAGVEGRALLEAMIRTEFKGRIALVSSFGAEAAVLLDLVAQIDPATPVVFLDTGKLFGETLRYRDTLISHLKLTDVRSIRPDPVAILERDPDGILWKRNPDACCNLRKTEPMQRALEEFDSWITGRKRFQSATRAALEPIEANGKHVKINPLVSWTEADLEAHLAARDLPRHPLVEDGYLSIGCMPCTDRVPPGGSSRDGRWAGLEKTECGIHLVESDGSGI